jgi:hypothetical protein
MTELAHSPIGASSMYRWSACPGSVRLSRGIASKSSKYAEEGTEAHEWAAKLALGECAMKDAPEEMHDALSVYVAEIQRIVANPVPGVLYVVDYKHGAGIAVEVTGNPQLRYYALGTLVSAPEVGLLVEHKFDLFSVYLGLFGTADAVFRQDGPIAEVEMVIVQPRCPHPAGPVRRERISAADLIDFATELIDYAKATESPDAPVVPGDHCRFCPASGAGRCPAIREKANAVAARVFAPGVTYDAAELADALRWAPVLEAWLKNMREFAYAEAEAGRCPPGFKLVAKRANRAWKDVASAEQACKALGLGELEMYGEPNLVSPAQIEKALTARKIKPADRKAALDPLVESVSSGHTLVADSDPRPPVRQDAAEVFSNV